MFGVLLSFPCGTKTVHSGTMTITEVLRIDRTSGNYFYFCGLTHRVRLLSHVPLIPISNDVIEEDRGAVAKKQILHKKYLGI